jgi:hypothetical protein
MVIILLDPAKSRMSSHPRVVDLVIHSFASFEISLHARLSAWRRTHDHPRFATFAHGGQRTICAWANGLFAQPIVLVIAG